MTDHGLSVVVQEDCAILRVFDGEVCEPYHDFENDISLAALEPLAPGSEGEFSQLASAESDDLLSGLDYAVAGTAVDLDTTSDVVASRRTPIQLAAAPRRNDGPIGDPDLKLRGYLADNLGSQP